MRDMLCKGGLFGHIGHTGISLIIDDKMKQLWQQKGIIPGAQFIN